MKDLVLKIFTPTLMFAWAIAYYVEILGKKASAGVFIRPVFWLMAVIYVIVVLMDIRDYKDAKKGSESVSPDDSTKENDSEIIAETNAPEKREKIFSPDLTRTIVCVLSSVAYIFAIKYIGFLVSTVLFLFGLFCWLKAENKILAFILAVVIAFGMYMLFKVGLKVPLPKGFIGI